MAGSIILNSINLKECISDEFCFLEKTVFQFQAKENRLRFYKRNRFNPGNATLRVFI
jgi:hypothetical protein